MNVLRVLTLNIWNRQGPWEQRVKLIRAGLERLQPDLVALQEVLVLNGQSQADEIAAGLGYETGFGMAHDLGGGMQYGNAVLSRWPIASCQAFPLPISDEDEQRALVLAKVSSPHGTIPFFTTHLNWKFHHGIV